MKKTILTATMMLVAGTTAACGGSAPKDASVDDFCQEYTHSEDNESGEDAAKRLEDVGTPKDMPDDARHGFEVIIKLAKKDDGDMSDEDKQKEYDDLSDDDKDDVDAFLSYASEKCADQLKEQMEEQMPEMPDMSMPSLPDPS
ncbi:MAG TPA: hypothetical protein VGJ41_02670 [Nocardioides sp.]